MLSKKRKYNDDPEKKRNRQSKRHTTISINSKLWLKETTEKRDIKNHLSESKVYKNSEVQLARKKCIITRNY